VDPNIRWIHFASDSFEMPRHSDCSVRSSESYRSNPKSSRQFAVVSRGSQLLLAKLTALLAVFIVVAGFPTFASRAAGCCCCIELELEAKLLLSHVVAIAVFLLSRHWRAFCRLFTAAFLWAFSPRRRPELGRPYSPKIYFDIRFHLTHTRRSAAVAVKLLQ